MIGSEINRRADESKQNNRIEEAEQALVIASDLDGTLTSFTGPPGPFLGNPLSPEQAVHPYSQITKQMLKMMFSPEEPPTVVITGNTLANLQDFLTWGGVEMDPEWKDLFWTFDSSEEGADRSMAKLRGYKRLLRSTEADILVFEDSTTLLPQIILLDPERITVLSAKKETIAQQLRTFLRGRTLDSRTWNLFLDFIFEQFEPQRIGWIRLKKIFDLLPKSTLGVGPEYLTISTEGKKRFRVRRQDFAVLTLTGKTGKWNLFSHEPEEFLDGAKLRVSR